MTSPSKRKGDAAELAAAKALAELTGLPVRRKLGAGRADDTGDIYGVPDTTIEVKSYTDVARAVRDGLADLEREHANSGDTFAACLVRRRGRSGVDAWAVVMTLPQYATYVRETLT